MSLVLVCFSVFLACINVRTITLDIPFWYVDVIDNLGNFRLVIILIVLIHANELIAEIDFASRRLIIQLLLPKFFMGIDPLNVYLFFAALLLLFLLA